MMSVSSTSGAGLGHNLMIARIAAVIVLQFAVIIVIALAWM